ncbi:hypothetical protein SRHO_G00075310 [Serrasalmus rhombeus]
MSEGTVANLDEKLTIEELGEALNLMNPALIKHQLVQASSRLQEKICSQHDEVVKIYCRTDQSCICYLCTMHEHKGHDTVAAAAERTEKQNQLEEVQRKSQQRLQQKEKKLQELKQAVVTLKRSAQAAVEDSERIFTELIRSIEKKRSEVTKLIRTQEKNQLRHIEELQENLQQDIDDLKRRNTELEQLSVTEDHIQFLQSFQSLRVSAGCEDSSSITVHQHPSFDGVRKSLSDLKERLEEFCKEEFRKISPHAAAVQTISCSEPRTRADFLQYFCPLTLDPNTVHHYLSLSEQNRVEDQRGVYSCPQCRETFTLRPVLRRNNMLAEVVEKLKKPELQAASPAHCYAGPGDVESLIKHQLVQASSRLQQKICSQHDEVVKIYCRTDQSCICYLCTMHEHKGHDTVAAAAERTEKQNQLKKVQKKSQQRLQQKEKKLQELKQAVVTLKRSAQAAVEDSERIFTELIRSIEKKRSEVTKLIRTQEKNQLRQTEELLENLQQEIDDLKRRNTELEQLSVTEDHIQFLQSFQSLSVSAGCEDSSTFTVHQHPSFDGVRKSLSELKERLEEFCKEEFRKISPHERAHRIGPVNPKYTTPRVVIIKFVNWRDRETVLKAARKTTDLRYENHRVSFFPDLSAETRKLQRNFDDVKARFRALGVRYGMLYPAHLIITHNDKRRIFKSVTEAEKYIQEISPHSGATRGYAAYAAHMGAALEWRQNDAAKLFVVCIFCKSC